MNPTPASYKPYIQPELAVIGYINVFRGDNKWSMFHSWNDAQILNKSVRVF